MKAYLGTTGVIFALVTLAHLARIGEISRQVARDPWFVAGWAFLTLLAASLSVWAWKLFRRLPPSSSSSSS
jgi:hypothetical protein